MEKELIIYIIGCVASFALQFKLGKPNTLGRVYLIFVISIFSWIAVFALTIERTAHIKIGKGKNENRIPPPDEKDDRQVISYKLEKGQFKTESPDLK